MDEGIVISPSDPAFDPADGDPSVSPRDDFYRWVNGGWLDRNPVPPEYGAFGAMHELHEQNQAVLREILDRIVEAPTTDPEIEGKVATYFRSGMDTDRIEALGAGPVEPWIERIASLASKDDLPELLADLHEAGFGGFFGGYVAPDFERSSDHLLYIAQGGLGLPDRDYYFREDATSQELLADYRAHITVMFDLFDDEDADTAADTILSLENAIAEPSYTNVQQRDVDLVTNRHDLEAVAQLSEHFDFVRYLDRMGAGRVESINIDNVGFYPAIGELIRSTGLPALRTYLRWNVYRGSASSLARRFDDQHFAFYGTRLAGQKEQKERWKRVLGWAGSDIGFLVAQLYVREKFPPESRAAVEHMVDRLVDAMRERLEAVEWMGDATRAEALRKLDAFGYKIGYPDVWRDYGDLELTEGEWFENRIACARFESHRQVGNLEKPVDDQEWSLPPHVVNAYYHPTRNEIAFPAGILQPPFFDPSADHAVNYGAIGAVIGHEVTHGFDDTGSKFDADGAVRNWWAKEDRDTFEARARVMVEQFNQYEVEEGLHVNGELTLGENIADLGGLKIALAAMHAELEGSEGTVAGLTATQRFFMAWARAWRRNATAEYTRLLVNSDPHSPSHLRILGPLSNLPEFAEAFGLPEGSDQVRKAGDRVDIW